MKPKYYLLLLVVVASFSSCDQRLYFPERANSPAFKGKNELKATFAVKPQENASDSAGKTRGSEFAPSFDIAYSITDHFAVLGSYRSTVNRYVSESQNYLFDPQALGGNFNGHRFEVGAGYFSELGKVGRIELFGGFGNGVLDRTGYSTPGENYNTSYNRYFIQPAMGFSTDIFTVMGGVRLAAQNFYSFQSADPNLRYTIATSTDKSDYEDVTKKVFTWAEPFINMEIGYKYAKFDLQTGFSYQLSSGNISGDLPLCVSAGFTFYYAPRFFKTRPERVLRTNE